MTDWPIRSLGEVCEVLDSLRKPITKRDRTSGDYPYYGATGIVDYVGDYIFHERLVLVGEDGAKWGAGERTAFIAEGKYWVNNHAHVLRCKQGVLVDSWLANFLTMSDLNRYVSGLTVPKLNQGSLVSIEIPVPPLDEQKRIVELLDAATARVTELTACYEQARTNVNDFFTSALTELFEECAVDESAKQLPIGEICEIGDGNHSAKYPKSSEFVVGGIPFIRANNISNGEVSAIDMRFISEKKHKELKKGHLRTGDVLITNRGEIGSLAIVGSGFDGSNLNSQIAWLRVSALATNRYLYYFLGSPNAKEQFFQGTTGAALQQLTISQLRKIRVPIVSLKTQQALTERLDKLKSKSSEMVAAYEAKLTAAKNLRQSILESAFAGEL